MTEVIRQNRELIEVIFQLILIVIPIVITWVLRNFVKSSVVEKKIGSIARLANEAIDFVENADKQGKLNLPPDVKKNIHKLNLAAAWLQDELERNGVKVSKEDAEQWISAEIQNRLGEIRPASAITELTRQAVDMVYSMLTLPAEGMPAGAQQVDYLSELAADWLAAQLRRRCGMVIRRDEAITWVRAEMLERLQAKRLPSTNELADLARQGVDFLQELKNSGRLALRSAAPGINIESDVVIAWMLTEAARLGLSVTPDEISNAATRAMQTRSLRLPA